MYPQYRFPVKFDKNRFIVFVDQAKVCTPNPSIMRRLLGIARSLMAHIIMCILSGMREMKSQKVSCAEPAWGIS